MSLADHLLAPLDGADVPQPVGDGRSDDARPLTLAQGTGSAYPGNRASAGNRPQDPMLAGSYGFDLLSGPTRWEPTQTPGPPYAVKDAAFHAVKRADHAHDRMVERTPYPRGHADAIQRLVDAMGLREGTYYLPLRDASGRVHGYAAFKTVPNRRGPVLATVLGPDMKPRGSNLETLTKTSVAPQTNDTPLAEGLFTTDTLDPRPPESTANRVMQPIAGNFLAESDVARKLFNDLRMTQTDTIDTSDNGFPPGGLA